MVKYKEKRDKKQGNGQMVIIFFGILFVLRLVTLRVTTERNPQDVTSSPSNAACIAKRPHILSGRRYGKDIKVSGITQIGAPSC
jgi:hypothetical protein